MRTKSVLLPSVLALLTPLTALALGIQVMIDGKAVTFVDVPQTAWFASYVQSAAEAGIVNGYKDEFGELTGNYGPANNITIAEALKIAVEGAGYDEQLYASRIESGFDHWASPYASVAKGEGFAVIDARARLDSPATRAEVAALFTSAFQVDLAGAYVGSRYNDVTTTTEFGTSIEVLSNDGVVSGDTDVRGQAVGTFRPTQFINRAEVAKIVTEARSKYGTPGEGRTPDESGGDTSVEDGNTVAYSSEGFSPMILRIKLGESVTFKNESSGQLWVASNPHPQHTGLPGFDAGESILKGDFYIHEFNQLGSWSYHNHLNSGHEGTIIVE